MEVMARSKMIDIANRRTEQRAKSLDLNAEFFFALQELCLYQRWWWRKKIVAFTITAGNTQFNMADAVGAADFQEAVEKGVKIYTPTPDQFHPQSGTLHPVFDLDEQQLIIALQAGWPTGQPCRYFVLGAGPSQFVVDRVPDKDYMASIAFWAMPNFTDNSEDESIPLVPYSLHTLLLKRLEMRLLSFSLGEDSTKYAVANKEFEAMAQKAAIYRNFADGERQSLVPQCSFDAVQST